MPVTARQNALQAGVSALIMLIIGWAFAAKGVSASTFYNTTVDVFFWSLRIGGIAMAISAALCAADFRIGLLVEAMTSALCGLLMTLIAVYWLVDAGGLDLQYLLYVIFGVGFITTTASALRSYRAIGSNGGQSPRYQTADEARAGGVFGVPSGGGQSPHYMATPVAEAVHPASVRPASLPKEGEPPPPEGYLAALAKEKDEPPTASFE
ncbi:MAG TPA: hypothetical protein VJZ71_14070 [Phycisphaerae bacterium]|nr:hypothetical protein [Phycisphaerae bacterium]